MTNFPLKNGDLIIIENGCPLSKDTREDEFHTEEMIGKYVGLVVSDFNFETGDEEERIAIKWVPFGDKCNSVFGSQYRVLKPVLSFILERIQAGDWKIKERSRAFIKENVSNS